MIVNKLPTIVGSKSNCNFHEIIPQAVRQLTGIFGLEASLADLKRCQIWPSQLNIRTRGALVAYDIMKFKSKRDLHTYTTEEEIYRYFNWVMGKEGNWMKKYYQRSGFDREYDPQKLTNALK